MTGPPTLLSVTAFARTHDVSKAAAQKWEAKGYLTKREGKVWAEASDRTLQHAGLGRFSEVAAGRQPAAATGNPSVAAEVAAPTVARDDAGAIDFTEPETLRTLDAYVERLLSGEYPDMVEASTVKENALALKHVLAARKEAGRLVEVELAEQVLFEEFRAVRDAWLGFPARIAPLMAAELGVDADRLIEGLTAHVQQQLDDLGEPEADFQRGEDAGA